MQIVIHIAEAHWSPDVKSFMADTNLERLKSRLAADCRANWFMPGGFVWETYWHKKPELAWLCARSPDWRSLPPVVPEDDDTVLEAYFFGRRRVASDAPTDTAREPWVVFRQFPVEVPDIPSVSEDPVENDRNPLIAMARLICSAGSSLMPAGVDPGWCKGVREMASFIWMAVRNEVLRVENENRDKI